MKQAKSIVHLIVLILFAVGAHAQVKPTYKIASRINPGGDGGWDYLTMDEGAGLLYVSHGTIVQVINVKDGKLTATIDDTKGVHGITIAHGFGKGYISCGKDSSVVVFDTKTFKTLSRIKVNGSNPDAILFDLFSKRVFVFNGRSKNVSVIDATADHIIGEIPVEGKPEFAVTDEKGKVYVNIEDKGKICMINSQSMRVENCWSVAPADEPSGLAIDNENHRLFSVSDEHMVVVDALTGRVVASLPIGDRVDGVAYDPILKRAYSANGDGTMTVVQQQAGDKYEVVATVPTQKGARTIDVDTKTHHLYLPTADLGKAPEPSAENKHPRPTIKEKSFVILDIAPE